MLFITPDDPSSEAAVDLIARLSRELAERYSGDSGKDTGPVSPSDLRVPRSVFLLAWFGGDAAGCGAIRPFDERTAEVKQVFVVPNLRSRGIGRDILRELEQRARDFGFTRLVIESGDRQPEALALCEKEGFRKVVHHGTGGGDSRSAFLEKDLSARPPGDSNAGPGKSD